MLGYVSCLLVLFCLLTAASCSQADLTLETLRRGHPRLMVTEADLRRTRELVKSNDAARAIRDRFQRECEKLLTTAPVTRTLKGPRLLHMSRRAFMRVYKLAGMYRLEGDRRFAERAIREMLAAAAFSDWNPGHFLDVAEMTHALGVGYDWLYDVMTAAQRQAVREAIVKKGLLPALKAFKKKAWFFRSRFNWNQVCSGGILVGALAVAEEEPEVAAELVRRTTQAVRIALASYAPDGGWAEGPAYWNYATRYTVYLLAALQTALGDCQGIDKAAGLDVAGLFRIHTNGPGNLMFNFADCGERLGRCAEMFWLARRYERPIYARHERQETRSPQPLHLLWFNPEGAGPVAAKLPTDAYFRGVEVVTMRSAWEDPTAVFVGFKGGDNTANHGNLDLGTFVLDADGVRWAIDLGGDSYALPAYFGKLRWTYYRMRTEGHNTLTLEDENQNTKAKAPIVTFLSTPDRAHAVADLSAGYTPALAGARRGVALLQRRAVLVQDEVTAPRPLTVHWAMHTRAKIAAAGRLAELTFRGRRLRAEILSPRDATFSVQPVSLRKPQRPTSGVSKLMILLHAPRGRTRIRVMLRPYRGAAAPPEVRAPITDLKAWQDGTRQTP